MPTDSGALPSSKRTPIRLPMIDLANTDLSCDIHRSRPSVKIALDCIGKAGKNPPQKLALTDESLIQSFMNGSSSGFINGLEIAYQYLEKHSYLSLADFAIQFKQFVEASKDEQIKGS